MKNEKKLHYGWIVCILCMFLAFGAVGCTNSSFGAYFPMMREYAGISNTQCSMITMIRNLTALIVMTQVDKYLKKMGLRKGVILGLLMSVSAMILYGLTNNFVVYCVAAAVAGIGYSLAGLVPISVIISRWFIAHRAFAVSLAVMGTGFATVLMPPIATGIATSYSLRTSFFVTAGIIFVLDMILVLFLPEKPEDKGFLPLSDEKEKEKHRVEVKTTASRSVLILVSIALIILAHMTYGSVPNLALLFTTEGLNAKTAAFLVSLFGITMTVGKMIYGIAADKFGVKVSTIITCIINLIAISIMILCGLPTMGIVFAVLGCILFGPGNALATVGITALTTHFASSKDYAVIVKKLQVAYTAGSVLIGPLPGIIADLAGSYVPAYLLFAGEMLLSLIILVIAFYSDKRCL